MPLRPPARASARARARLDRALETLNGLSAKEQLEASLLLTVTVLSGVRPRFERSQEDRAAFDFRCDDVEEWLNRENTPLRFIRTQ
jgi:hypothetical protein